MSSFTIELVSNASFDCYRNNTLSSFTNFLPEQINFDGEWEVAIKKMSYPSLYQNITEGKFFYLDEATPDILVLKITGINKRRVILSSRKG